MGGEQFFAKHHAQFLGNEKGSFAQGTCQWESVARTMLFEVVHVDTSSWYTDDAAT